MHAAEASVTAPAFQTRTTNGQSARALLTTMIIVSCVWVAMFLVRLHAHQANADDFFYGSVARNIGQSSDPLSALLHTGQNAPLVPGLAAFGAVIDGIYGGITVGLPLLLLLCLGCFVLARIWLTPWAAAVTSLLVALNSGTLGYSVMLNFALASTAAVLWCFTSYLRSNRLRNWNWSLGFGVALSALVLSRSVAPVYAVPMILLVFVDVVAGSWKEMPRRHFPALGALGVVALLAGPWWFTSGSTVLRYLTTAGYQASSGYTSHGAQLSPTTINGRVKWELVQLGWMQSVILGLALLVSIGLFVAYRRKETFAHLWMLPAWTVLTLLILSSSSNMGTEFGLPLIAILIVTCSVIIGRVVRRSRTALGIAILVLTAIGSAALFTSSNNPWWHGPPYRTAVISAGGTSRTNVDSLTASIAHDVDNHTVVMGINSPIVNGNGILWFAGPHTRLIEPKDTDSTEVAVDSLRHAHFLFTGTSLVDFSFLLNQNTVATAAVRDHFHPVRIWRVSPSNSFVLWSRSGPRLKRVQPPATRILNPAEGARVVGSRLIVASASDLLGLSKVTIKIWGGPYKAPLMIPAQLSPYGWIGAWTTSGLPSGKYSITSVAVDLEGTTGESRPVSVELVSGQSSDKTPGKRL